MLEDNANIGAKLAIGFMCDSTKADQHQDRDRQKLYRHDAKRFKITKIQPRGIAGTEQGRKPRKALESPQHGYSRVAVLTVLCLFYQRH